MIRILTIIAIILFFILATKSNNIENPQQQYAIKYQKISGKASIIDGDSIKIRNQEIRLINIDAPEYTQECLDQNMQKYKCGIVAKDFLKKIISNKEIICKYHKKDIYNRILGKCHTKETQINKEMVKAGWAILYNFRDSTKEMKKIEILARKNKQGLWNGSFLEPQKYRKQN